MSLGRILNGALTGEGVPGVWSAGILGVLFAPVTYCSILFLGNGSPWYLYTTAEAQGAAQHSAQPVTTFVIVLLVLVGLAIANGALALPLARWEKRNREQGKSTLTILTYLSQFASRLVIGGMGLIIPLYLLFASPIDPFGPPSQIVLGGYGVWAWCAVVLGAISAAIELFFFPTRPSRKALRKLKETVLAKWD
jgi:hypothetical protein